MSVQGTTCPKSQKYMIFIVPSQLVRQKKRIYIYIYISHRRKTHTSLLEQKLKKKRIIFPISTTNSRYTIIGGTAQNRKRANKKKPQKNPSLRRQQQTTRGVLNPSRNKRQRRKNIKLFCATSTLFSLPPHYRIARGRARRIARLQEESKSAPQLSGPLPLHPSPGSHLVRAHFLTRIGQGVVIDHPVLALHSDCN